MMVDISGKRGKIIAGVIVLCLLISSLLIGGATWFQKETEKPLYQADEKIQKGETEVITEESLSYIPKTATGVYTVAPQGQEDAVSWWKSYQLISKYRLDLPLDIAPVAEQMKQITLVQMPREDRFEEDLALIVKTEDEESAIAVMEHFDLNNPDPNSAMTSYVDDLVFMGSPTSFEPTRDLLEGNAESIVSNKEFVEDTKGAKDSVFWFDVSGFFDGLSTEWMEEEYPEFMDNLQGNLMGFQEKTRWVGTSENHGDSWVGKFASGGYDAEKQDVNAYEQESMQEIIYYDPETGEEYKGDPTQGKSDAENGEVIGEDDAGETFFGGHFESGPGLMALDHVSVLTKGSEDSETSTSNDNGTMVTGKVNNWATGNYATPPEDEALDYFDTVIMFSPSGLMSAITGAPHGATNIHMHTLRIKDNMMEIQTDYTSTDPKNELIADKYEDIGEN